MRLSWNEIRVRAADFVHPNATLADLYDPDLMPVNLRKAHQALDRAVDRLYRRSPFLFDLNVSNTCSSYTKK